MIMTLVFYFIVLAVLLGIGYLIVFRFGTWTFQPGDVGTIVGVALLVICVVGAYIYFAGVPEVLNSRRTTLFRATAPQTWMYTKPAANHDYDENADGNGAPELAALIPQLDDPTGVTTFAPKRIEYTIRSSWLPVSWTPRPRFFTVEEVHIGNATVVDDDDEEERRLTMHMSGTSGELKNWLGWVDTKAATALTVGGFTPGSGPRPLSAHQYRALGDTIGAPK